MFLIFSSHPTSKSKLFWAIFLSRASLQLRIYIFYPIVTTLIRIFVGSAAKGEVITLDRHASRSETIIPTSWAHTAVDGRNPAPVDMVNYPIIYKVSCMFGGAGFLPSTVVIGAMATPQLSIYFSAI